MSNKQKNCKKKVWRVSPLVLTAITLAVTVAVTNYWVGGPSYEVPGPGAFDNMTSVDLAVLETRLQMLIAKESLLRRGADGQYYAIVNLAFLRLHQGRKADAVRLLEKAMAGRDHYIHYSDAAAHYLANLYLQEGRVKDANAFMDKWAAGTGLDAGALGPDLVVYYRLRAEIKQKAGETAEAQIARQLAEKSLRLPATVYLSSNNYDMPGSHVLRELFTRACGLLAQDKYAPAKRLLLLVLKGMPDVLPDESAQSDAMYMLPVVEYCAGDYASCEKSFERAAQIPKDRNNSAYAIFCHHYSQFLRKKGRTAEADKYAQSERDYRMYMQPGLPLPRGSG